MIGKIIAWFFIAIFFLGIVLTFYDNIEANVMNRYRYEVIFSDNTTIKCVNMYYRMFFSQVDFEGCDDGKSHLGIHDFSYKEIKIRGR